MINQVGWPQPVVWPLSGFGAGLADAEPCGVRRLPKRGTVVELESNPMNYSDVVAREPIIKHPSDVGAFVLGFDDVLPAGETISDVEILGVEVIDGTGANTLAVTGEQATTEDAETTWGVTVPSGRGVRFVLSGGVNATTYKVSIEAATSGGTRKAGAVIVELHV